MRMAAQIGMNICMTCRSIVLSSEPTLSADAAQLAALVKKYKPIAYVNGHDHVVDYAAPAGYATNFIVSGALSGGNTALCSCWATSSIRSSCRKLQHCGHVAASPHLHQQN